METSQQPAVTKTLHNRLQTYGTYYEVARITRELLASFMLSPYWDSLEPDQQEALHMIASKLARILNGDPNYADSWHDIGGYAALIRDRLQLSGYPPFELSNEYNMAVVHTVTATFWETRNWKNLTPTQHLTIYFIRNRFAKILNGDHNDSRLWDDIAFAATHEEQLLSPTT